MPMGIILTDGVGKILHANAAAEDMLDGCPLLCLEDELASRDSRSDAPLRAAIIRAGNSRSAARARKEMTSLIVNGPGSRSLAVWVMPITGHLKLPAEAFASPRVAVFATAMETTGRSAAEMSVRRHALTVDESRLLALLAKTLALDAARRAHSMPIAGGRLAELLLRSAPAPGRAVSEL